MPNLRRFFLTAKRLETSSYVELQYWRIGWDKSTIKVNVHATRLEIKKPGRVDGDIETEIIEIELGAKYNGKLQMKSEPAEMLEMAS